ncbi:MAG TPA: hypothetical protein DGG95_18350, partial [Cytophagales bacterium]|nr:hypothetical protein [Cytophagales bacterium]
TDSTNDVLTFTWSEPKFSAGLSQSKFTVYVSPSGSGFSSYLTKSFTDALTGSLLGKELNQMALRLGGTIGQPIDLDMKVVASLNNNNEVKSSTPVKITVTPYSDLQLTNALSNSIVTAPATYASVAATLNWNRGFIGYEGTVTYQLQYAKGGTNFASPTVVSETSRTQSYTQGDLNTTVAVDYGTAIGSVGTIDFRIVATNGASQVIYSNVLTLSVTTSKVVPKYTPPAHLYIVGGATPGGWSNPVNTPTQELTQIDENTFGAILQLTGGQAYDFLPVNGSWSDKYNVASGSANPMGDAFQPSTGPGSDIPAPANSGVYKIIVDFVKGTYTLTALASNPIPANLFIVGDATPGGWSNPVPLPSQQLVQITNADFQLSLSMTGGKFYDFLPVNGDWSNKFNVANKTVANPAGDTFQASTGPGDDIPAPAASATYLIDVNFLTMKYKLQ